MEENKENKEELPHVDIPKEKANVKKFTDYYSDPAFREKHLKYVREKVICKECGKMYSRSNISNHKKTKKHLNNCKKFKEKNIVVHGNIGDIISYMEDLLEKVSIIQSMNKVAD